MKIQANSPLLQPQTFQEWKKTEPKQSLKEIIPQLEDQPVKLSISKEGMEAFRKMVAECPQSPSWEQTTKDTENMILVEQLYGSLSSSEQYFATEEEVLSGKDMSDTIVSVWFSKELEHMEETYGRGTSWQQKADRIMQVYGKLRDEIIQGYQNGTREVRIVEEGATVADLSHGTGYRILTMDEELKRLDEVYEKKVRNLEKWIKEEPKNLEILSRIEESRMRMGLEPKCTKEYIQERYDNLKTVPDNLAQKMIAIRDKWRNTGLTLSDHTAWQNVIDSINAMFRHDA